MILDKKFDIKNKGKSIGENFDGFSQAKVCISLYNVHLLALIHGVSSYWYFPLFF